MDDAHDVHHDAAARVHQHGVALPFQILSVSGCEAGRDLYPFVEAQFVISVSTRLTRRLLANTSPEGASIE